VARGRRQMRPGPGLAGRAELRRGHGWNPTTSRPRPRFVYRQRPLEASYPRRVDHHCRAQLHRSRHHLACRHRAPLAIRPENRQKLTNPVNRETTTEHTAVSCTQNWMICGRRSPIARPKARHTESAIGAAARLEMLARVVTPRVVSMCGARVTAAIETDERSTLGQMRAGGGLPERIRSASHSVSR
jgi:hypothetical protein